MWSLVRIQDCYISTTGRHFPHLVHSKAAEQEVTCAQDSTKKSFIGSREMCWAMSLARHLPSRNFKCSMSACCPSAKFSCVWTSVCMQRWPAKAWARELVLFFGLSLFVGWLQTNHFSVSCLLGNWNSFPYFFCKLLRLNKLQNFTDSLSTRVCEDLDMCIAKALFPAMALTQRHEIPKALLSPVVSLWLWLTIAFSLFSPSFFFLFFFYFKASLSTWSFSRNIWHDDTGVWQVTSLETQRHEEKSKTLLISL